MRWVALVAAKDSEGSVAATVEALAALRGVDEVWVVDDGSTDGTAAAAANAGARVVRLDQNLGKGGALAAGLAATGHAPRYLLADADLGATASGLQPLIDAHDAGAGTLVVGVLPSAGGRGGFGTVKRLARAGVRRACGATLDAPLSGQRAVVGEALRGLTLAPRFGVEVGMTIDLVRLGGTVGEVPVEVEHRHTGRSLAGFQHRARQGRDIIRALIPRLWSVRQRVGAVVAAGLALVVVLSLLSIVSAAPRGSALPRSQRVVVFAFDHLGLTDLDRSDLPGLRGLVADGVAGALSVRTTDRRSLDRRSGTESPSAADAWASLGASARVRSAPELVAASLSESGIASTAMRTARTQGRRDRAPSLPGALGDALHAAGKRTAFIGGARLITGTRAGFPAATALADRFGRIDSVDVSPGLLEATRAAPGVRASVPGFVVAVASQVRTSDVVVVDPGEMARAYDGGRDRLAALRRTDAILAGVRGVLPPGTTLVVVSATPPGAEWELTPLLVYSDPPASGTVASSSTRRSSMAVLTDVAPTVLNVVGARSGPGMTGAVLRRGDGSFDTERFAGLSRDGAVRSRFFLGASVGYTVIVLAFYLLLLAALAAGLADDWRRPLRVGAFAAGAFPFAMLVTAALQHWGGVGGESPVALGGLCLGIGALFATRRGLTGLYALAGGVVAVVAVDVAVTGPLQTASLLGYSLQTTGRFYGLPNASFAVFGASLLVGAAAVAGGLRAAGPVRAAAAATLLGVGVVFVGAPWLGNDVGGTVALVPVAAALAWRFTGRRLSRQVVGIGGVGVATVLGLVLAVEAIVGKGTHLGRAFGSQASLASTLRQRAENNLGLLIDQWWGFLVFALAIGVLVALQRGGLQREIPEAAPLRATVAAVMVLSLLAFAVNDSGPVVAVLCLVVVAPVLALRAIDACPPAQSRR